tara:strand:+ start:15142 stop:15564 length:423 start_codon:yes stop_codon:yes gene_type:complete
VKYAFITLHKKTWPVDLMCRLLGVAYYRHCVYQKYRQPDPEHEGMLAAVKAVATSSGYRYGSRRMRRALNALAYPVGRRKTRSLMREAQVRARYRKKYKATTNSNHKQPVFENVLQRQFTAEGPDQAWVSALTYIWTQQG